MGMTFGYKATNSATGADLSMAVRNAACWAPLKQMSDQFVLQEITWLPNRGKSEHIVELLPLLFPDVKYIVGTYKFNEKEEFSITFTGLEDVYRNSFMFRMFVIRNIDRDVCQYRAYEYLRKLPKVNLLEAAVVAANLDQSCNGWGRNTQWFLKAKGYACCFGPAVTVADVKAFARNPAELRNKKDWKFGEGRGFGYGGKTDNHPASGRAQYYSGAMMTTCTGYKPSRPQFHSQTWRDGNQLTFCRKLFGAKAFPDNAADLISKVKVTK